MTPRLKETDYLVAWILFFLCATAGGFVAGAVAGGILGGILGAAGISLTTIKVVCGFAGFIIGVPISYLFFRVFVAHFIVRKLTAPPAGVSLTPPV